MASMTKIFVPSPQQAAFLAELRTGTSSIVLEAVAGAGKTTTIVEGCKEMRGTVFLGAYNSKMGAELKARTAGLTNVRAGTFHSAGYNALRRFKKDIGDPNGMKVRDLIEQFIQEKNRADLTDLADLIAGVVSMAKQRGIGCVFPNRIDIWEDMIEHFDLLDNLPESWEGRDETELLQIVIKFSNVILGRSNELARSKGVIDFDDMCYLSLLWNLRMFQNDWVIIDEAQDTNPTRRALARKMLRPGGRLVAVGDPHQAIYGFSGADNDSLDQIRRDFNAKTMPLSVTFRCPKAVVREAQNFVSHIEAADTAPEGIVRQIDYSNIVEEAKPGDAILCRYNKYLVSLCFRFIKQGISARIEGRAIGQQLIALTKKWKTNDLQTLGKRVVAWQKREGDKAKAKKNDRKFEEINDRAETVLVLVERAIEKDIRTVAEMRNMVTEMFDDNVVDRKDMITLCSGHRSKGLEWDRVLILGLYEFGGRQCAKDWQTQQEINLQYVEVTRAQQELILVNGVREERKQHSFEEA